MPHDFAHTLVELKRRAGALPFDVEEALTIIRNLKASLALNITTIQTQLRGPAYFVEDNAVRRNFVINPSFEHDLTSWSESGGATGTTGRSTIQKESGKQSLELVITAGSIGQGKQRAIVITGLVASETWSVGCGINYTALANTKFILRMEFLDSGSSVLATHETERTTTTSGFITLDNDNRLSPSNTDKLRITLILSITGGSPSGTAYIDSVIAEKATTSAAYFDGDSQDCFWEITVHAGESINDVDGTAAICGYFKASA